MIALQIISSIVLGVVTLLSLIIGALSALNDVERFSRWPEGRDTQQKQPRFLKYNPLYRITYKVVYWLGESV